MAEQDLRIAVLPGDGIGVDVTDATIAVIEGARRRVGGFVLHHVDLRAGAGYFRETGRDEAPPTSWVRTKPTPWRQF